MWYSQSCSMENFFSHYSSHLTAVKDWVLALSMIPVTLFIHLQAKSAFEAKKNWLQSVSRGGKDPRVIDSLWTALSGIIGLVGFNFFLELAPLEDRIYHRLNHVCFVFTVVFGLLLLKRMALLGIDWSSQKADHYETFDSGFVPLLQNILSVFVTLTGGIVILKHFNYDVMSFITALGVSSLAVGLAAKDTLSNMISGFILIMDRNLKPGDRISLGPASGDVKVIGLRSTQIRTTDGNTLIVPNSELVNTRIVNLSLSSRQMISQVQVRLPSSIEFSQVRAEFLKIAQGIEKIDQNHPISVNLLSLSDGHPLIGISYGVSDFTHLPAATSDLNAQLLAYFNQNQIPLLAPPFHR
ncbi:MAG: mechanosensitive ion channel family protein [Bdellovibrionia bacterium]